MANRVFLFILILLTGLLRLPGLLIGIALILLRLLTTKSFRLSLSLAAHSFKSEGAFLFVHPAPHPAAALPSRLAAHQGPRSEVTGGRFSCHLTID